MKGFGKLIFVFSILTATLVVYVHERVEIFRVSYKIQRKTLELAQRTEEHRRLKYDIARLHSPQHLEKRLEELSLPLTLPQEIQVLRVPQWEAPQKLQPLPFDPPQRRFFGFLGDWVRMAQARTDQ